MKDTGQGGYSLYTDILLFFFSFFSKTLASVRASTQHGKNVEQEKEK